MQPSVIQIILLSAVSLVLPGCQNSQENAKERLKHGVELLNKGDLKRAEVELKSAQKEDSSLADSYYYMALLNEKNREFKAMKQNLEQAVKLNPSNIDARLKLGRLQLLFDEPANAIQQAEAILSQTQENLAAKSLKAAIFIKQKKTADALAIIDAILQNHPQDSEALGLKAVLLMQNESFDQALAVIEPALANDVNNLSLYLMKTQIDAKRQDIVAVIKDYEQLVSISPENNELKVALAKLYLQAKRPADSEKLLLEMVNAHPEKVEFKLAYLDFLLNTDKAKAESQLQDYLQAERNKPESLLRFAGWLITTRQIDTGEKVLDTLVESKAKPELLLQARLLQGELAFARKQLDKALGVADKILADNAANIQAQVLKAKVLTATRHYEAASAVLDKVLWAKPDLELALVMQGEIELLKRDTIKADKKFRDALAINPANSVALQRVATREMGSNHLKFVDELLTKARKFKPEDLSIAEKAAEVKILQKDWPGASEIIEAINKLPGSEKSGFYLQAKLLHAQDKCSIAIKQYKDFLTLQPENFDALNSLAQCYTKLEQTQALALYLAEQIKLHPSIIGPYIISSRLNENANNDALALNFLQQALAVAKQNPDSYIELAEFYIRKHDHSNAIKYYQKGLESLPGHVGILLRLAENYGIVGEFKKAEAIYDDLIKQDPNQDIAINNLASILLDHYGDSQSLQHAKTLVEVFKDSEEVFFLDSYGWAEAKVGDVNKAISTLEKVTSRAPEIPVFKYHLGFAYHKQGNNAGAIAQLQEAINLGKKYGNFPEEKASMQLLDSLRPK